MRFPFNRYKQARIECMYNYTSAYSTFLSRGPIVCLNTLNNNYKTVSYIHMYSLQATDNPIDIHLYPIYNKTKQQ